MQPESLSAPYFSRLASATWDFTRRYWRLIVVAMLALLHPLGVVVAAIFVAGIFVGADAMSRSAQVPSYIAQVMVATALLAMVTALMFTRYRVRWK